MRSAARSCTSCAAMPACPIRCGPPSRAARPSAPPASERASCFPHAPDMRGAPLPARWACAPARPGSRPRRDLGRAERGDGSDAGRIVWEAPHAVAAMRRTHNSRRRTARHPPRRRCRPRSAAACSRAPSSQRLRPGPATLLQCVCKVAIWVHTTSTRSNEVAPACCGRVLQIRRTTIIPWPQISAA